MPTCLFCVPAQYSLWVETRGDPEAPTVRDSVISYADGTQIIKDNRCNIKHKQCRGSPNAGNNPTTARTSELWMNI